MGNYMYSYIIEAARMYANIMNAVNNSGNIAAARMSTNVMGAINASTATGLELSGGGSGNRFVYIDFHADDTWSDFALRIARTHTGENAQSKIEHRGTGTFLINTLEAAAMEWFTTNTRRLYLTATGNLLLGGATAAGTNAVSTFLIKNGTPPASSPADSVQLYAEDVAGSSELKARDEAGNTPTLTPHNFSLFKPKLEYYYPWSYHSKNPCIGKEINVDMEGAIRAIEELSGKKFIYTRDLLPEECENREK